MNTMKAAELLIQKIEKDYKDDIAMVVMYGSRLYEDTHEKSDIDLFFIPKTKRGEQLGLVFIIDGIGFDFWPISWERLEGIANFDERLPAIIAEGKILYCASNEDLARYSILKDKILTNDDEDFFYQKAKSKFKQIYEPYYKMNQDNEYIALVRLQGIRIIYILAEVIALLNKTYIKRGRGFLKKELLSFEFFPIDFDLHFDLFFTSSSENELVEAVKTMVFQVESMITDMDYMSKPKHIKDTFKGFYEEIINHYNKIERACEIGDTVTALCAAAELNIELEGVFEGTEETIDILPGILPAYSSDSITLFCKRAKMNHNVLLNVLDKYEVEVTHFADFEALEDYLDLL
ncbi:MAG: hypothetical protein Q7I99_09885 [Acholeplasmataceae bacterium]|nr:hypothetical protein [Acholeplasmataceae bacterium]